MEADTSCAFQIDFGPGGHLGDDVTAEELVGAATALSNGCVRGATPKGGFVHEIGRSQRPCGPKDERSLYSQLSD